MVFSDDSSYGKPDHEHPFRQGMLFTPVSTIEFTGDYHTLILKYEPEGLAEDITTIQRHLDKFCEMVRNELKVPEDFRRKFAQVTQSFYRDVAEMKMSQENFVRSITSASRRPKRGIFMLASIASSILLGLGSLFRTNHLAGRLEILEHLNKEELAILSHHTTEIEILKNNMTFVMDNQAILAKAMGNMAAVALVLGKKVHELQVEVSVLLSLDIWDNILGRLRLHLQVTKEAILRMLDGRLDSYFINPARFSEILKTLSIKHRLFFPVLDDFLSVYYDLAKVIVSSDRRGCLVFFVELPLKSLESQFTLYHIRPIPIPVPFTNHSNTNPNHHRLFVTKKSHVEYIAVSDNRKWFTTMSSLEHCRLIVDLHICEPMASFMPAEQRSCAVSAFLDKEEAKEVCPTQVMMEVPPIFLRQRDGWFYATAEKVQLTLRCRKDVTPSFVPKHVIKGVGIIQLPPGCEGHAPGIFLPSQWHSSEIFQFRATRIDFDANLTLLSTEDHTRLQALEVTTILSQLKKTTGHSMPLAELGRIASMEQRLETHSTTGLRLMYLSWGALAATLGFGTIHLVAYCVAWGH